MSFFVPAIDPLYAIGGSIGANRITTRDNAQKEFATIFMTQILKEVFKGQSELFGEEGALGMFSENLYNDIFLSKIAGDMASSKSLGFDRIFQANK